MATAPNTRTWLRRAAFAAGLVSALTLALIGRLPASGEPLGLSATLSTGPTGELAVAPVGRVASATGLLPGGGGLRGHVLIESQVDRTLSVRVRVRPSIADADQALHVRLASGALVLYDGPVGGLRVATAREVSVAPHGHVGLDVRAWLPSAAPAGWRGRSVTLPLEYASSMNGRMRR
jgi:hypothetical protein